MKRKKSQLLNLIHRRSSAGFSLPIMSNLVAAQEFGRSLQWQNSDGSSPANISDELGRWDDLIATNHFSQVNDAKFTVGATGIIADGLDNYMTADALAAYASNKSPFTLYLPITPEYGADGFGTLFGFSKSDSLMEYLIVQKSAGNQYRIAYQDDTNAEVSDAAGIYSTTKQLMTFIASSTESKLYVDGILICTLAFSAGDSIFDSYTIGALRRNLFLQQYSALSLHGHYLYSVKHNDTDRGIIETALMSRFGI